MTLSSKNLYTGISKIIVNVLIFKGFGFMMNDNFVNFNLLLSFTWKQIIWNGMVKIQGENTLWEG
jgi:hypothetical protein